MFRYKLSSWLAIIFCAQSLANMKNVEADLKQISMAMIKMGITKQPHVVVVPFPAQGHVMPLMKLSQLLVDEGFNITFVNMEFVHKQIMDSLISLMPEDPNGNKDSFRNSKYYYYYGEVGNCGGQIRMVTVLGGLMPEQQKDVAFLFRTIDERFPDEFERLMKNIINEEEFGAVSCVIADDSMSCALEVARKMGIRGAAFFPSSAALKALAHSIPALIQNGIIHDDDGTPKKNEKILLSPTMPPMDTAHFAWCCLQRILQQIVFQAIIKNDQTSSSADWILCNSSTELESGAFSYIPNLLPIGPLITLGQGSDQLGSLRPEDPTCFQWLDQQATNSVIYASFGSTSIFNQAQLNELALGLELLGRPFLWVVREDFTKDTETSTTNPNVLFQDGVSRHGKIVRWAPQQKVLGHPSVACFISHCGWNSTMEGISMGVPFICWPYFADQFLNRSYITDVWKVGLGLDPDENGMISRHEIKKKVEQLLGDEGIRARAQKLKEDATSKGGLSSKNFDQFVKAIKE